MSLTQHHQNRSGGSPASVLTDRQTYRHTHTHTDRQTNWSENITPPRFRGGVKRFDLNKGDYNWMKTNMNNQEWSTRSIQRTQTPPHLWYLILWCDPDLTSRSRKLMAIDDAFCIIPWYRKPRPNRYHPFGLNFFHKHSDTHTDRQTYRQGGRLTDRLTNEKEEKDRHTDKSVDWHWQTDWHTERKRERDRQTLREIQIPFPTVCLVFYITII